MIMRGNRGEGRFSRVGEGSGEMRGYRRENGRGEKRGENEERKGGVERKRDNVCYWDTSFLALPLFLSLLPLAPFSTPFFHLSNLNAHRRLSSPRLAVFSTEITSELMDLWQATQRGRLNLSAELYRLCTYRYTAQLSVVNTRIRNVRR